MSSTVAVWGLVQAKEQELAKLKQELASLIVILPPSFCGESLDKILRLAGQGGCSTSKLQNQFSGAEAYMEAGVKAPEDNGKAAAAVGQVVEEVAAADEANLLDEEDMDVFGREPMADSLSLVTCNRCSRPVKGSQYAKHAVRCQQLQAEAEAAAATTGLAVKKPPRKARKKPPADGGDGTPSPRKRPKANAGRAPLSPVELDTLCGVLSSHTGAHCRRSISCKYHPEDSKRAVSGRRRPYDVLLAEARSGKTAGQGGSKGVSASKDELASPGSTIPPAPSTPPARIAARWGNSLVRPLATKAYCIGNIRRLRSVFCSIFTSSQGRSGGPSLSGAGADQPAAGSVGATTPKGGGAGVGVGARGGGWSPGGAAGADMKFRQGAGGQAAPGDSKKAAKAREKKLGGQAVGNRAKASTGTALHLQARPKVAPGGAPGSSLGQPPAMQKASPVVHAGLPEGAARKVGVVAM